MSVIEEALRKSSQRPRARSNCAAAVSSGSRLARQPHGRRYRKRHRGMFRAAATDPEAMERNHVLLGISDVAVARAYKILRTRVLHRMHANNWQLDRRHRHLRRRGQEPHGGQSRARARAGSEHLGVPRRPRLAALAGRLLPRHERRPRPHGLPHRPGRARPGHLRHRREAPRRGAEHPPGRAVVRVPVFAAHGGAGGLAGRRSSEAHRSCSTCRRCSSRTTCWPSARARSVTSWSCRRGTPRGARCTT